MPQLRATPQSSQEKGLETQGNAESSEGTDFAGAALVVYSDGEEETLPEEARTSAVKRRLSFDGALELWLETKVSEKFLGLCKRQSRSLCRVCSCEGDSSEQAL